MSWARKYVGLPFSETFNCWSLCRRVLLEECGIDIDPFAGIGSHESPRIQAVIAEQIARDDWIRVGKAEVRQFDIALMRVVRRLMGRDTAETLSHIGIITPDRRVLHVEHATNSCAPRLSSSTIDWRLHSFYRHRSLA